MTLAVRAPTQAEQVLAMLRTGAKTTLEIRACWIMSPAFAVHELRRAGHVIVNTPGRKHVASYRLVKEATA